MQQHLRIALALVLVASCRDKTPAKQAAEPPKPSVTAQGDPQWLEKLPQVAGGDTKLILETTAGLVAIKADGSIHVAKPPTAPAADPRQRSADPLTGATPVQSDKLVAALELPALAPRGDTAFTYEGSGAESDDPSTMHFARLGHPAQVSGAPAPATRATTVFGTAHEHDVSAGVVVFADANAPATVLADVLGQTGGFIAVRRDKQLGALPLAIDRNPPAPMSAAKSWVEVRLGPTIEVGAVPSKPTTVPSLDGLAAAVTATGATAVDVLVAPETKVQELVTAISLLHAAKIMAIGIGRVPAAGSPEAAARADRGARVVAWNVGFMNVDRARTTEARSAFDSALEPLRACYEKALAKEPTLTATTSIQLAITKGVVKTDAGDAPPVLAKCIATSFNPVGRSPAATGATITAKLALFPH